MRFEAQSFSAKPFISIKGFFSACIFAPSNLAFTSVFIFVFTLLLALNLSFAAERPFIPELPLGTGSAAFAGGGFASQTGVDALFSNPAALSIFDGFEIETGMMDIAGGFSPYLLYGAHANDRAAFSMGYYYDGRVNVDSGGASRQGILAGGSWIIEPGLSVGASMHSLGTGIGVGRDGFGVDFDAGIWTAFSSTWRFGLAGKNLAESGVGLEPAGYRTRRSYLLGIGQTKSLYELFGLQLHDPNVFYELRARGFALSDLAHAFTLGSAFTPGGRIALRGTLLFPQAGVAGYALGIQLNLPSGRLAFIGSYTLAINTEPEMQNLNTPTHAISINFRMGTKTDIYPPLVAVNVDPLVLQIDSNASMPKGQSQSNLKSELPHVFFRLTASDRTINILRVDQKIADAKSAEQDISQDGMIDGKVKSWSLIICPMGEGGKKGKSLKVFSGKDLPPKIIRWDAVDANEKVLPAGFYAFQLKAEDFAGNAAASTWQLLELKGP